MASAASLPIAFARLFAAGLSKVADPGDAGTIYIENKGIAICEVVTAGAETRVLPAADAFGVGSMLFVTGKTLVGAATITGAIGGNVVLGTAGDSVVFVLIKTTAKYWYALTTTAAVNAVTESVAASGADQVVASTGASRAVKDSGIATANLVTRASAAAGAGLIPVSNGADKALKAATPVALGAFTVSTNNDATTNAKLVLVINQLVALGLFTGTAS